MIVDLSSVHCAWCGMSSDDARVYVCPSCARLTCYECVYLLDDAMQCVHSTPQQRGVLTRGDWKDAP